MKEEHLLTGSLEPTNEPYAIAKIAGLKLCEAYHSQFGRNYYSVMPTNLYGIGDNFDLENSHVLPALLRKFHEAKINGAQEVVMWGTGTPRREFLYSDDLADACIHLLETQDADSLGNQHINVGVGEDISIRELAELIKSIVGYDGEIVQDLSKPDGTPRKLLSVERLHAAGWKASTSLRHGIQQMYTWYLDQITI
jgi:GDP-L-fucose synthase